MNTADILTSIINALHTSQYRLEHDLNLPTNSTRVNDIINGRTKNFSRSFVTLLLKAHPELNPAYLENGEGSIFVPGYTPPPAQPIPSTYDSNYVLDCLLHAYMFYSDRQFCKRAQISATTVSNMRKNNSVFADKNIAKVIANIDSHLSRRWLKTGMSPMYDDGRPDIISPIYDKNRTEASDVDRITNIETELAALRSQLNVLTHNLSQYTTPPDGDYRVAEPTEPQQ